MFRVQKVVARVVVDLKVGHLSGVHRPRGLASVVECVCVCVGGQSTHTVQSQQFSVYKVRHPKKTINFVKQSAKNV